MGQGRIVAGGMTRGEVRLVRFRPPDKERPALVLTRQSSIKLLTRVTVAPITSTVRGVDSEVMLGVVDGMKRPCAVNLHNLITVHHSIVGRCLATLTAGRMREVCAALAFALGCEG
jgi:mRNA interferase MazF